MPRKKRVEPVEFVNEVSEDVDALPPVSGSTKDGPRYSVSLATPKEPNVYRQFFETENRKEAENECVKVAEEEGRECIVFDRLNIDIFYRHNSGKTSNKESKDAKPKQ